MKQTFYIVAHVDYPVEDFVTAIVDPDCLRPQAFLKLEDAQKVLEEYLERGLEYTILSFTLSVN